MSARAWKQKKPTPLDRGPPLHVNRPLVKYRRTLLNLNSKGPYPSSEREIKFRRCLFTFFSVKREIRHFHVVVGKKSKEIYKSELHVQSCCFWRFRCHWSRRLTNSALFPVTAEHRNIYLLLELRSVYLVPVERKTKRFLTVGRASEGAVVSWSVQRSRSLLCSQKRTYPNSSSFNPPIHKAVQLYFSRGIHPRCM